MAAKKTQKVQERLALAAAEAAKGNYAAAAAYSQAAANIQGSGQAKVQSVANQYAAQNLFNQKDRLISGAEPQGGGNDGNNSGQSATPPPPSVVNVFTKRALGGKIQTVRVWSDGREEVIDEFVDKSAGEAAAEMFRMAGLDASFVDKLMQTIDNVYNTNVAPTQAQILNTIYNSDAYKQRFAGNEIIRKRLADGTGRPGDRLLNPADYIAAEASYREILQNAGMPEGYYDTPEDFTQLIGNSVSALEFKSRVDTAYDALNFADENVVDTLQQYYGLSRGDLVAYLLDPTKAAPILQGRSMTAAYGLNDRTQLQKAYESSKVGGAAARQGLGVDRGMSEEIVDLGKSGEAEAAFAEAGAADLDVRRLGSLYGEAMDFKDLVRESLNLQGGVEAGRKKRKFASKERAAFGGQGALDKKSLSRMQDI